MNWRCSVAFFSFIAAASGADGAPPPATEGRLASVELSLSGAELVAQLRYELRGSTAGVHQLHSLLGADIALPRHGAVIGATVSTPFAKAALERLPQADADQRRRGIEEANGAVTRKGFALIRYEESLVGVEATVGIPGAQAVQLGLTIGAPTCAFQGRRWGSVPADWIPRLTPVASLRIARGDEETTIEKACRPHVDEQHMHGSGFSWVGFPDPNARPPARGTEGAASASAARFDTPAGQVVKMEVALPTRVAPMPVTPHVAILLDASRSITNEEWKSQLEMAAAYLAHAPDARVLLLPYARAASPVAARWMTATAAGKALQGPLIGLRRRNGSNVSEALRVAGKRLREVRGQRRVLLVTDGRLAKRERVRSVGANSMLPSSTPLVVVNETLGNRVARDDTALFADAAKASGGIAFYRYDASRDGTLELWRPTAIDELRIAGGGWSHAPSVGPFAACPTPVEVDAGSAPASRINEGHSCEWWGFAKGKVAAPIVVEGLLWNRAWRTTVTPGTSDSKRVARELSVALAYQPEDALLAPFADDARAAGGDVNAGWSLFATWGSGGGYGDLGGGGTGRGSICCGGSPGTFGRGSGTGSVRAPWLPVLTEQVTQAVARCVPAGVTLKVFLETTLDEVVDVLVTGHGQDRRSHIAAAKAATCAEEIIWDTDFTFGGDAYASPAFNVYGP